MSHLKHGRKEGRKLKHYYYWKCRPFSALEPSHVVRERLLDKNKEWSLGRARDVLSDISYLNEVNGRIAGTGFIWDLL